MKPNNAKDNDVACQVSRKMLNCDGVKPVVATDNLGNMSRSPRYEWPNTPTNEGTAATRNRGLCIARVSLSDSEDSIEWLYSSKLWNRSVPGMGFDELQLGVVEGL